MERASLYLVIFCITQCVYSESDNSDCDPHGFGGYSHPEWWCETLCAEAPDESPININTSNLISGDGTCTSCLNWQVDWRHDLFQIENNCHSLQVTPMGFNDADILSPFNDYLRAIAILRTEYTPFEAEYKDYCLAQFHFHWGENATVGSEHNVDGNAFPLEAHFVHYACEYGNFTAAAAKGKESAVAGEVEADHTLAVVSILFETSERDNRGLDVILSDAVVDKIRNCTAEPHKVIIGNRILDAIVPRDVEHGGYYAYKGSLTTPPCTDDVNWFVMKTHGLVSERQLQQFRELLDEGGEQIERNWRDIQDNVNTVMHCEDAPRNRYKGGKKRGRRPRRYKRHYKESDDSARAVSKDMRDVIQNE